MITSYKIKKHWEHKYHYPFIFIILFVSFNFNVKSFSFLVASQSWFINFAIEFEVLVELCPTLVSKGELI